MIPLNIQRFAQADDYSGYLSASSVRKTSTITRLFRQQQMLNFYNTPNQMYISLGKTTPWTDPDNPNISDTYPPVPSELTTVPDDVLGVQRITWKKFALPYTNPTESQKKDITTVYYKGLYYKTFDDQQTAIQNGCTAILILMTADRNEYFPISNSIRQACLIYQAGKNVNKLYYKGTDWLALSTDPTSDSFRGNLVAINNFSPISRSDTQLEKYYFLLQF